MEAAHVAAMVMEVEEDDDVFFADLKRQISLLITEDVEDDHYYYSYPSPNASSLSIHQIQQAFSRQPQYQLDYHHHHHHHDPHHISTYKTSTITDHQQSKGTGVFIPNSSPQFNKRRNNKHQSYKVTNYYYNNNKKKKYKLSSSYRQQIMQVPSQEGVFAQVRTSSQMHIVNQH